MRHMNNLRKLRARWAARRFQLARDQILAERTMHDPNAEVADLDAFTGSYVIQHRALNRVLGPKAKSSTEWRGD
jgi:hypothetical protein